MPVSLDRGRRRAPAILLALCGFVLLLLALRLPLLRAADEPYSLVVNGSIHDIPTLNHASLGRLVSLELFSIVARADGRLVVAARPERGLLVLTSPAPPTAGGTPATLQGFKTASITLLVNQDPPLTVRGHLVGGVPFLETHSVQTVLERLGFNVLVAHESLLISVFRPPADAGEATGVPPERVAGPAAQEGGETGGGEGGQAGRPPGAGMLEAVQRGALESLQRMGAASGADLGTRPGQPPAVVTGTGAATAATGGSGPVCRSMDQLRGLWDATEPSAREKTVLKELARKFQEAKDKGGRLEAADLETLASTLTGFQQKVDRRAEGTRGWTGPDETAAVKRYGVSFLETIDQVLDLSQEMVGSMRRNDQTFVNRAGELIRTLQGLERTAQEQGSLFNVEVTRVRQAHGCGPATLGLPPT